MFLVTVEMVSLRSCSFRRRWVGETNERVYVGSTEIWSTKFVGSLLWTK